MKAKTIFSKLAIGLLLIVLINSCSKKDESPNPASNYTNNPTVPVNDYTPPAVTFSSTVMGFVQDAEGNPIQNAVVSTGTSTFTTDANGAFELTNAAFTGDFCYIKASKNGFFTASTTIHGKAGSKYTAQLVMVAQNNVQNFNSTEAKTITLPSGAKADFPANAIKKLDGTPYTGTVNVAIHHINPADKNFSQLIPGGDLRAYNAAGENVQLYSYGMLNIELHDDAGNYLQLADGKKATLTMPVPATMQSTAPTTIPLWYFDENKGIWIEEGEAKLQNGVYTGEVSHFTPWNCDWSGPRAYIKGKLVDCDGEILTNMNVRVGQILINTNENGVWDAWVPAGIEIEVKGYNDVWVDQTFAEIKAPKLSEGQTYDVGNVKIKCVSKISATIKDCNNNLFNGYAIFKYGGTSITIPLRDGKLNQLIYTNNEESAELFFHQVATGQLSSVSITIPKKEKKLDLGVIKACPTNAISPKFSFDYDDGSGIGVASRLFNNFNLASAIYYKNSDRLEIQFQSLDGYSNITIAAPKVGTIPASSDSALFIALGNPNKYFYDENITFNIQKYEGEGGEISGTFSGNMKEYTGTGAKTITITNGKFTVLRLPDK